MDSFNNADNKLVYADIPSGFQIWLLRKAAALVNKW